MHIIVPTLPWIRKVWLRELRTLPKNAQPESGRTEVTPVVLVMPVVKRSPPAPVLTSIPLPLLYLNYISLSLPSFWGSCVTF